MYSTSSYIKTLYIMTHNVQFRINMANVVYTLNNINRLLFTNDTSVFSMQYML